MKAPVLIFAGLLAALPASSDTSYDAITGELVTRQKMPVSVVLARCRELGYASLTCGQVPGACAQGAPQGGPLPRLCAPADTPAACDTKLDAAFPRDAVPEGVCAAAPAETAWDETCRADAVKRGVRPRPRDPRIPTLSSCLLVIHRWQSSQIQPTRQGGRNRRLSPPAAFDEGPGGE